MGAFSASRNVVHRITPPSTTRRDAPRSRLWEVELVRLASVLKTLPSDVEKTTFLRRYTGGLIDIGRLDAATERRYRALDLSSFNPAEFYPLFRAHTLPA